MPHDLRAARNAPRDAKAAGPQPPRERAVGEQPPAHEQRECDIVPRGQTRDDRVDVARDPAPVEQQIMRVDRDAQRFQWTPFGQGGKVVNPSGVVCATMYCKSG